MRYLTKAYFQYMDDLMPFDTMYNPIKDRIYSDKDIQKIYQQEKDEYISDQEDFHNTAPEYEEFEKELGLELTDIWIADLLEDGSEVNFRHPSSWGEYEVYKKMEHQRALEEFQARPPFDRSAVEEDFEDSFRFLLDPENHELPDFVFEQVDIRLLALHLMPQSVFEKLEKENRKREKWIGDKERETKKQLKENSNNAAYEMLAAYLYAANGLVEIKHDPDGTCTLYLEDKERFIMFEKAEVLENEVQSCHEDLYIYGHEVYDLEKGYEVHFILFDDLDGQYKYLTLSCSNFSFALDDDQEKRFKETNLI